MSKIRNILLTSLVCIFTLTFLAGNKSFALENTGLQEDYKYEIYDNGSSLESGSHKLEIAELGRADRVYQGYCLQLTKHFPPTKLSSKKLYKKLQNSDEETLQQYVSKYEYNKPELTNLRKQISKVVTEGYPINKNGYLNELSEQEKIEVTQDAVWYFTEATAPVDKNYSGKNATAMKTAYLKLIDNKDLDKYTNTKFDIFVPQDESYQAVISVEPVVENIPATPLKPISKKNISAKKIWIDAPDEKPIIYLKLFRKIDGGTEEVVNEAELKKVDSKKNKETTVTWEMLPVTNIKGEKFIYSVKEVDETGKPLQLKDYVKKENELTVTNTYIKPSINYNDVEISTGGDFFEFIEDTATEHITGENSKKQEEGEDSRIIEETTENNLVEFGEDTATEHITGENPKKQEEGEDSRTIEETTENNLVEFGEDTATEHITGENPKKQEEVEDSRTIEETTENNYVEFGEDTMPKEESGSNKSNVVEEIEEHNLFEFTENTNTEKIRGENKGNQIEIEESPQTKEFTGQNKHKKYNNFKEKSKENSKETIKEKRFLPNTGSETSTYKCAIAIIIVLVSLLIFRKNNTRNIFRK